MPVVLVQLPDVNRVPNSRPTHCPYCSSQILHGWGQVSRTIHDLDCESTAIQRYRCTECGGTFRHYPEGVDSSKQSVRIRKIAALAWLMGMSTREIANLFAQFGVVLTRSTIWREATLISSKLKEKSTQTVQRKYTIDPQYKPNISSRLGVVLAFEADQNKRIVLGTVDEHDPRMLKSYIEPFLQDTGFKVSILGTDFLDGLPQVTIGTAKTLD